MKTIWTLAAIALFLGVDARAAQTRSAYFAPVSKAWAVPLKNFAKSLGKSAYPVDPDMTVLAKINPRRPDERRLLAPLVASLRERGVSLRRFKSLDREERRRLMSAHAGNDAVNAVIAEVHSLRDRAENPAAGAAARLATRRAIERIRKIVELYAPFKEKALQTAYDSAR